MGRWLGGSGEGKRGYLRISMDIEELFLAVNEDSYIFSLAKLSPHNERCQGLGFLGEDSAKMHVRTQTGHIVPPPHVRRERGHCSQPLLASGTNCSFCLASQMNLCFRDPGPTAARGEGLLAWSWGVTAQAKRGSSAGASNCMCCALHWAPCPSSLNGPEF